MQTAVSAIFFDVMDTLVRDPFRDVMPRFLGLSLEELLRIKHPTAWVDFELGRIDERTFLEIFLPTHTFDALGFSAAVRESYELLPGIDDLLRSLRASHPDLRLYALSNYPCWYRWVDERCDLKSRLDGAFVSYELGVRKPSPEAYLAPCRTLGLRPEEALFIDDRPKNCEGAKAVGMEAFVFRDAARLREELTRRGFRLP